MLVRLVLVLHVNKPVRYFPNKYILELDLSVFLVLQNYPIHFPKEAVWELFGTDTTLKKIVVKFASLPSVMLKLLAKFICANYVEMSPFIPIKRKIMIKLP